MFDIPGIDRAGKNVCDLLGVNLSAIVAGKFGYRFQKPFHLGLRLKTPGGVTFKSFLNEMREALMLDEHHAAFIFALALHIDIADWCLEYCKALLKAGLHFLTCLPCDLLTLKLPASRSS